MRLYTGRGQSWQNMKEVFKCERNKEKSGRARPRNKYKQNSLRQVRISLIHKATGVCCCNTEELSFFSLSLMASVLSFSLSKPNVLKACSSSTSAATVSVPETLNEKFSRKGIKFLQSENNVPTVELTVRNGSSLKLQVPDALVTSYKPKVYWKDDGFEEILYTIPANEAASTKAKGGIGLVVNDVSGPGSKGSLLPTEWTVKDVDSDAIDALQVLSSIGKCLMILFLMAPIFSRKSRPYLV